MVEFNGQLLIVAHFVAVKGLEGELRKCFLGLLEPTRGEPGCLRYELNEEIDRPGSFRFSEKFVNREAHQSHMATPHVRGFLTQLKSLVEKSEVHFHRELLPSAGDKGHPGPNSVVGFALYTAAPGKAAELKEAFQNLVEPTRTEPGCIRYELAQDLDSEDAFSFTETFKDRDAFEAHLKMGYSQKAIQALPRLVQDQYLGLHRQL